MKILPALACLAACVPACAGTGVRHRRADIPPELLLEGRPLTFAARGAGFTGGSDVLAVSPEMQAFLDEHVASGAGQATKLRQLSHALMRGSSFQLKYDETTRTAAETFRTRRGNCMSFSNLFVALARQAGLRASFQEVDTPPDWLFRDDTFVLNRHVNVVVSLGRGAGKQERMSSLVRRPMEMGEHVVDFNAEDFRSSYDRRRISDARALAHYYNNVAVEHMQAGDAAAALAHFREALHNDSSFAPAWTNLGILYMRHGQLAYAEAAQHQALNAEPSDPVAMSNLAALYERRGDRERAAAYRREVLGHRDKNPYYRFQLARAAFRAEDYDAAIRHLKGAIRRKKNEDRFYFLLGLSHLKKGDTRAARRWLARAEEVAATDALKTEYAVKTHELLREAGGSE